MLNGSLPNGSISIGTDAQQYSSGQVVKIFGNVTDYHGKPVYKTINLNILDPSKRSVGAEQRCALGGKFAYNLANTQQGGTYTIIASTNGDKKNITISVLDIFAYATNGLINTNHIPLLVIGIGLLFGAILLYVLIWLPKRVVAELSKPKWLTSDDVDKLPDKQWKGSHPKIGNKHWWSKKELGFEKPASVTSLLAEKSIRQSKPSSSEDRAGKKIDLESIDKGILNDAKHQVDEVRRNLQWARTWRFICISGMVLSVITIYIFTPIELGPSSSLGLVKMHTSNLEREQWVLNFGGTKETNYTGGLHIPFYVFLFGIMGGYLRYLYSTAYPKTDEISTSPLKKEDDLIQKIECAEYETDNFLLETLKLIALIVLAPLLAIAVWFIVSGQGQTNTNVSILAALSLVIGLVTKEVVDGLISFAKGHLPNGPSTTRSETTPTLPMANAGPNQTVSQDSTVTLNGAESLARY